MLPHIDLDRWRIGNDSLLRGGGGADTIFGGDGVDRLEGQDGTIFWRVVLVRICFLAVMAMTR